MIVWFSGTGNSRYAAKVLADALGDALLDAGQMIKKGRDEKLYSERPWVFVAPTYAWRMARILEDYIRRTELCGSRDAYFVLTCGGDIGNAGKYAAELCRDKNLSYRGVLEVVMPENYIAMFDVPSENESRKMVMAAKVLLEKNAAAIRSGEDFPQHKARIGAALKSGVINDGFYKFYVKADAFYATEKCISCGMCAERCPLNNIRLADGKPRWGKDCTHCMACICYCPQEAIEYGKKSKGRRRYRCEEL